MNPPKRTHSKKKPVPIKPLPVAVDEMYWRSKIVSEFLEGYVEQLSVHANQAVQRMVSAIADYERSKAETAILAAGPESETNF